MHTPEGGMSYTLPFPAFKGGTHMVPIPGMAGLMALSIDLTILLFIQVSLWNLIHMNKVHSIWV